jgi:hypothetical protein
MVDMALFITISLGFGFLCAFLYLLFSKDKDIHKTISYASIGALFVGGMVVGAKLIFQTKNYLLDATDADISNTSFTMLIALMWILYTTFSKVLSKDKPVDLPAQKNR